MRNVYNKGKFRSSEYAKHLSPFLKSVGNKKWRQFAKAEISNELATDYEAEILDCRFKSKLPRKRKKAIKAKITRNLGKHGLSSSYRSYSSVRALNDSLRRNTIVGHTIY